MSSAGNVAINVGPPYPCWVEVCYDGESKFRMHHNELSDLKYAVEKAMKEAIHMLPDTDKHEV